MEIRPFNKNHIDRVAELAGEFDEYLQSFSSAKRADFDIQKQREKLIKYGFGKEKSFYGYIAEALA